jgi:hypothetical protein
MGCDVYQLQKAAISKSTKDKGALESPIFNFSALDAASFATSKLSRS